jgi:hypothetical protein
MAWRRRRPAGPALLVFAGGLVVLLLLVAPPLGVVAAAAAIVAIVVRRPATLLAISLNGFWLYLGALDLLDVSPRRSLTAAAYAVEGIALVAFIGARRTVLRRRLARAARAARVWLGAAVLLTAWFLANGVLLSHGPLAHRLLGVFVSTTVPTAVAFGAATRRDLDDARGGLVTLGLLFVLVEVIALRHGLGSNARFSPIAELDPVSAAGYAGLATVAAVTYRARTSWEQLAQACACAVLAFGAALPSGRGPLLALAVAVAVVLVARRSKTALYVATAVVAGTFVGLLAAPKAGAPGGSTGPGAATSAPGISSFHIRREWLSKSLRAIPDRPVFGHGIGMLVDDTPEATRMGVAGQRVYPHNDAVEAAYSLGALGLVLFAVVVLVPAALLIMRWRLRENRFVLFTLGLFVYAFAESNFSGEIGTDVALWSAAALTVLVMTGREQADEH